MNQPPYTPLDHWEAWANKPQPAQQQEPIRLRRGDILRCIETDELCTVWATSTTGKTLVKWSANDFGNYTAEQIGELFWIEPKQQQEPVATLFGSLPVYDTPSPAQPQQEPEGWNPSRNPMTAQRAAYFMRRFKHEEKLLGPNEQAAVDYVIAMLEQPAQRKPLTDADLGMYIGKELSEYINGAYADIGCAKDQLIHFARAIEAAHNIKDNT